MANYSVAEARNGLPRLIDKAIAGEEVVITRHGKIVAEVRAEGEPSERLPYDYEALRGRTASRPPIDVPWKDGHFRDWLYEDYPY